MKHLYQLLLFVLLLASQSCLKEEGVPVTISRLDVELENYKNLSSEEKTALVDSLAPQISAFFKVLGYENVEEPELMWWSNSDEVKIFQPDVNLKFPNLGVQEKALGNILKNARKDSIDASHLRFAAVTWGKPMKMAIVDSVVLIALNHYLGPDYPGYANFPNYRRAEKKPKYMPYDLAAMITASVSPFSTKNAPTVLNYLLYEGALVEAQMRLVDNALLTDALGYTPDQLQNLEYNLKSIKREMAEGKMIYSTDPDLIDRLFSGAPSSPLLNGKVPGRAGRFIGYTLVREYANRHPGATLKDLLSPSFYDNPASLQEIGF